MADDMVTSLCGGAIKEALLNNCMYLDDCTCFDGR